MAWRGGIAVARRAPIAEVIAQLGSAAGDVAGLGAGPQIHYRIPLDRGCGQLVQNGFDASGIDSVCPVRPAEGILGDCGEVQAGCVGLGC